MAGIALTCTVTAVAFVAIAASSGGSRARTSEVSVAGGQLPPAVESKLRSGELIVRAVDSEDTGLDGEVAVAGRGSRARHGSLACQRVHMSAGAGVCLALAPTGIDYEAIVFDRRFRAREHLGLNGLPSRTRVAPNGRLAAVTAFVTGHSYARAGEFSTSTRLLDLRRGEWLANLEDFAVYRNGERLNAPDVNLWGVTFTRDSRGFYATLATGSHHYLVRGDVRAERVDVVEGTDDVECPSLSPDGTRVAYKRTLGGGRWRLHVMDLRTGASRATAESRSIDDQVEWINDEWLAYGDGHDVWVTAADGGGKPRRLAMNAASPAVLR